MSPEMKSLLELPAEERLELAQALWDSVEPEDEARFVKLPEWQHEILRERLEDLEKNPDDGQPWEKVRAEMLDE
jgi:putative addiction module component (TIGR02574 family)